MKSILKITLLIFLFTSCGGIWENDDSSWERTFGEEKPKEIELINSYFWQSSHWTYEFEVFMEINYNQKWLLNMIDKYDMEASINFSSLQIGLVNDKPNWFIPKPKEDYILFESKKMQEAKILIDKKTNVMYFTLCQL